jgi:signal transduction histidine kinase
MGLGLALVREIITRHRGRLWAQSDGEGSGLTITFSLPATD